MGAGGCWRGAGLEPALREGLLACRTERLVWRYNQRKLQPWLWTLTWRLLISVQLSASALPSPCVLRPSCAAEPSPVVVRSSGRQQQQQQQAEDSDALDLTADGPPSSDDSPGGGGYAPPPAAAAAAGGGDGDRIALKLRSSKGDKVISMKKDDPFSKVFDAYKCVRPLSFFLGECGMGRRLGRLNCLLDGWGC